LEFSVRRSGFVSLLAGLMLVIGGAPALAHDTGLAINPDETTPIERQTDNVTLVAHHWFPDGTDMQFQRREGKQTLDGQIIDETRDFVFAGGDAKSGGDAGGIHVFDITDPTLPQHIADIQCRGYHSDIALYENLMVQSTDSSGSNTGCTEDAQRAYDPDELSQSGRSGVRIYDITDPAHPVVVAFLDAEEGIGNGGSHNITVVPWAGLLYLAQAGFTPDGSFTIVDLKDPSFPVTQISMQTVAPGSADVCHDIGLDPVRELAFCADIGTTHILDIADPMNPTLVTTIVNNGLSIHHGARLAGDGNTLVLGDEFAGAADQNLPSSPLGADSGAGANGCIGEPTAGALWFYDLSIAVEAPILMGSFAPTTPEPTASPCTAHFYNSVPDSTLVVTGWYEGGLIVTDFSEIYPLSEYAVFLPELGNFWSGYYWHGYLYGNSRTIESKGFGGGLWIVQVDGIEDAEPSPGDEGTTWARWTSQLGGSPAVVTAAPAEPDASAPVPTSSELPATGNGFALASLALFGAYLALRWRNKVIVGSR
jgi:hypothetical protein